MYWFPRTKLGKISFWAGVFAFALLYIQYWIAMIFNTSFITPGILVMLCILGAGVSSLVAIIKYRDIAILLFLSSLIGLFGVLLIVGEFIFPH